MPGLSSEESVAPAKPKGVLRTGWSARTEDYPIAGGWALGGELLVVGDAAGGVYGFAGKSGELEWVARDVHQEGLLSLDVSPDGVTVATVGQDGRLVRRQGVLDIGGLGLAVPERLELGRVEVLVVSKAADRLTTVYILSKAAAVRVVVVAPGSCRAGARARGAVPHRAGLRDAAS